MPSMKTNYVDWVGCPERWVRSISEAGFRHVDWHHHWNDDFLYSLPEIRQIQAWLRECSLEVNSIHGSSGQEKCWSSATEYERLAGVELVRNRIELAAELSCQVVVMHLFGAPDEIEWTGRPRRSVDAVCESLDDLESCATSHGVTIAVENGYFEFLDPVLSHCSPEYVGLCYDVGHGNFNQAAGLIGLDQHKDRLAAVHAHDNDATDDVHNLPFTGTVDWERLTRLVAASPFSGSVTVETIMATTGIEDEQQFLTKALEVGTILDDMICRYRS